MAPKPKVVEEEGFPSVAGYEVRVFTVNVDIPTEVWFAKGDCTCTRCKTAERQPSRECLHVKAVKRFLKKPVVEE